MGNAKSLIRDTASAGRSDIFVFDDIIRFIFHYDPVTLFPLLLYDKLRRSADFFHLLFFL